MKNKNSQPSIEVLISKLEKLLGNLNSLHELLDSTSFDSEIGEQTERLINDLSSIVQQAQKVELMQASIRVIVLDINELVEHIVKQKEKNPLVPSELVSRASKLGENTNEVEVLLSESKF